MRIFTSLAACASIALGLQVAPDAQAYVLGLHNECPSMLEEAAQSCAKHRVKSEEPLVVFTSMFKDTPPAELIRQLEYHFLLGVELAVLFDNSCPSESSHANQTSRGLEEALHPYIERGLVIFRREYRCVAATDIYPEKNPIGGSGLALQLMAREKELHQQPGTLMLALDDDEYVVMNKEKENLYDLRSFLSDAEDPSTSMPWRMYGSSDHVCQPTGPVMRHFTRALKPLPEMTEFELQATQEEAERFNLNPPFGSHSKKFAVIWKSAKYINRCDTHKCGIPSDPWQRNLWLDLSKNHTLVHSGFSPKTGHAYLAHYAYQSEQRWSFKKSRGRTTHGGTREGGIPARYSEAEAPYPWNQLVTRIRSEKDDDLRACLAFMFFLA